MLQQLYWLSSVGRDSEGDEVSIALHMSLDSAIEHAKKFHCKEVYSCFMTKDAICRLHNGSGGYVDTERLVWTNQSI